MLFNGKALISAASAICRRSANRTWYDTFGQGIRVPIRVRIPCNSASSEHVAQRAGSEATQSKDRKKSKVRDRKPLKCQRSAQGAVHGVQQFLLGLGQAVAAHANPHRRALVTKNYRMKNGMSENAVGIEKLIIIHITPSAQHILSLSISFRLDMSRELLV